MPAVSVELPPGVYDSVLKHLLRPRSRYEEAAFLFADAVPEDGGLVFRYQQMLVVPRAGLLSALSSTSSSRTRPDRRSSKRLMTSVRRSWSSTLTQLPAGPSSRPATAPA